MSLPRWRTKSGVLVEAHSYRVERYVRGKPDVKVYAVRIKPDGTPGGFHGWLWQRNLKRAADADD